MKVAGDEKRLRKALRECRRRGERAFGSGKVYLERYIERPRHVEVQVLADHHGRAVHLFERECSIQRRHQKVIEEAPSPLMRRHPGLRERMTGAALALVSASAYANAGTVEFIVDPEGQFFFLEMNTRLQVEHAVTEMTTGLDLVELQLRVAAGEALPVAQADIALHGHAIECRVYAEDTAKGFLPGPGRIGAYEEPQLAGLRVDSGVRAGWAVTPHYDPLLAKLVAHGETRERARRTMLDGLGRMRLEGITSNLGLHAAVLGSPEFRDADFHTGWLERWVERA